MIPRNDRPAGAFDNPEMNATAGNQERERSTCDSARAQRPERPARLARHLHEFQFSPVTEADVAHLHLAMVVQSHKLRGLDRSARCRLELTVRRYVGYRKVRAGFVGSKEGRLNALESWISVGPRS